MSWLLLALLLSGCVHEYLIPGATIGQLAGLSPGDAGRAALPARNQRSGKPAWVLNRRVILHPAGNGFSASSSRRHPVFYVGIGVMALSLIPFGFAGDLDRQARRSDDGWGYVPLAGPILALSMTGAGLLLSGISLLILGDTLPTAEIGPGRKGILYLH